MRLDLPLLQAALNKICGSADRSETSCLFQVWIPTFDGDGTLLITKGKPFLVWGADDLLPLFRCLSNEIEIPALSPKNLDLQDLVAQVYVTGRSSTSLLSTAPPGGTRSRGGHPAVKARRHHMARCSMRQSLLLPLVAIVDSSGRTRGPYVAGVLEVARSKAASVMSEALLKLILCALGDVGVHTSDISEVQSEVVPPGETAAAGAQHRHNDYIAHLPHVIAIPALHDTERPPGHISALGGSLADQTAAAGHVSGLNPRRARETDAEAPPQPPDADDLAHLPGFNDAQKLMFRHYAASYTPAMRFKVKSLSVELCRSAGWMLPKATGGVLGKRKHMSSGTRGSSCSLSLRAPSLSGRRHCLPVTGGTGAWDDFGQSAPQLPTLPMSHQPSGALHVPFIHSVPDSELTLAHHEVHQGGEPHPELGAARSHDVDDLMQREVPQLPDIPDDWDMTVLDADLVVFSHDHPLVAHGFDPLANLTDADTDLMPAGSSLLGSDSQLRDINPHQHPTMTKGHNSHRHRHQHHHHRPLLTGSSDPCDGGPVVALPVPMQQPQRRVELPVISPTVTTAVSPRGQAPTAVNDVIDRSPLRTSTSPFGSAPVLDNTSPDVDVPAGRHSAHDGEHSRHLQSELFASELPLLLGVLPHPVGHKSGWNEHTSQTEVTNPADVLDTETPHSSEQPAVVQDDLPDGAAYHGPET